MSEDFQVVYYSESDPEARAKVISEIQQRPKTKFTCLYGHTLVGYNDGWSGLACLECRISIAWCIRELAPPVIPYDFQDDFRRVQQKKIDAGTGSDW